MEERYKQLSNLQSYIQGVDKEVTMILQSLQWDKRRLLTDSAMVTCKYDGTHKMSADKKVQHEEECFLKSQGYSKEDKMLPDPMDPNANTLIKLSSSDIKHIIDYAAKTDPKLKKGRGYQGVQPLTLDRLQATYTEDERRAIYDAVVDAAPSCHDLSDLALPSGDGKRDKEKSRLEVIAELRDMKRRRTKYRVAAKTKNYSDVLREVIKTQMELYTEINDEANIEEHSGIYKHEHKYERDRKDCRQITITRDVVTKVVANPSHDDLKHYKNNYKEKYRESRSGHRTRENSSRDRKRDKDCLRENKYDHKNWNSHDHRNRKDYKYSEDNKDYYYTDKNRDRKRSYDESRYGRELYKEKKYGTYYKIKLEKADFIVKEENTSE